MTYSRSSTNKTDRHDITEILFKVPLNTININSIARGLYTSYNIRLFKDKLEIASYIKIFDDKNILMGYVKFIVFNATSPIMTAF